MCDDFPPFAECTKGRLIAILASTVERLERRIGDYVRSLKRQEALFQAPPCDPPRADDPSSFCAGSPGPGTAPPHSPGAGCPGLALEWGFVAPTQSRAQARSRRPEGSRSPFPAPLTPAPWAQGSPGPRPTPPASAAGLRRIQPPLRPRPGPALCLPAAAAGMQLNAGQEMDLLLQSWVPRGGPARAVEGQVPDPSRQHPTAAAAAAVSIDCARMSDVRWQ